MVTMVGVNIGADQMARARRIAWIGAALYFRNNRDHWPCRHGLSHAWIGLFSDEPDARTFIRRRDFLLLQLLTDKGISGWGEVFASPYAAGALIQSRLPTG
jgi:hypothetical protein